jgi:hypothetical protein
MPRDPSVAHGAYPSLGFGCSIRELRAEIGGASSESRRQAVFIKGGQGEHKLCDGLLGQLRRERHVIRKRRRGRDAGRHFNFAASTRETQSCLGDVDKL